MENYFSLVKNNEIANKFVKAKQLSNICSITASLHESLNHVKGTVFAPFLNNLAEEEIVNELSLQGVVSVFKFKKNIDAKSYPTGVVLLTFNLYNLPSKIDGAWCKGRGAIMPCEIRPLRLYFTFESEIKPLF